MNQLSAQVSLLGSLLLCATLAGLSALSAEAATPLPDTAIAPSMATIALDHHGVRMNGLIYQAAGKGPHPVVLFLHGFPGNEKNLDLAQAARRAGWAAIYFNYRGSWGSGGTFSFTNALEDVATALAWIRTPKNALAHGFDPTRLAIVGHSFGGWLALQASRTEPPGVCVAVMAAWNVGWQARRLPDYPDERAELLVEFRDATDPAGGPLKAAPEALLEEVASSPAEWDYLQGAGILAPRSLLLISASRDTPGLDPAMHEELTAAIRAAGGGPVRHFTLDDDHVFSAHRLELADRLTEWLNTDCAAGLSPAVQ